MCFLVFGDKSDKLVKNVFLAVASFGFHQNVINELSSPAVRFKWDCNIAFLFLAFSMGELMVVKIRSSGCKSFCC